MISLLLAHLPSATSVSSSSSTRREATRLESAPSIDFETARDFAGGFESEDDARVVQHCLHANDEAARLRAFGVLLSRHRDRVLNLSWQMLGSRDDGEDAAQEAFTLAFRALPNFRNDAQFGTWIYRIAINVCLGKKRRLKSCEEWNEEFAPFDTDARNANAHDNDAAARAETRLHVAQTLDNLSPILRAVLVLREIHNLTYAEIARVLDIPVGTVRSRLSEARRRFIVLWSRP